MIFTSPSSACRGRVRQERHLAGVLDRTGDLPLLLCAHAGHPPRADLPAVGDELAQQRGVLVVDIGDALLVERVHLLLRLAQCRSLRHCSLTPYVLERRLVVEVRARPATGAAGGRGAGPRVVGVPAATLATAATATAATRGAVATATAGAAR